MKVWDIKETPFYIFALVYGAYLLPFLFLRRTGPVLPWSPEDGGIWACVRLQAVILGLYAALRLLSRLGWKVRPKYCWQHKDDLMRMAYLDVSLCFLGRLHSRNVMFLMCLVYFTAFYALLFEMVRHVNLHISWEVRHNPRGLAICCSALTIILAVLGAHTSMAYREGFLWTYGAWVALCLLCHGFMSAAPGTRLHLHHWYWAFLAAHFAIFDCALSMCAQAAFVGIYVHGAACFGLDPIYYGERRAPRQGFPAVPCVFGVIRSNVRAAQPCEVGLKRERRVAGEAGAAV